MQNYLLDYWQLIQKGEVVVGYYIYQEVKNLVDDLQSKLYTYDTKEAHNRIKFMQTCCLQSKEPYYGKPIKLLPFQLAFIEALYSFRMADTGLRRFTEALLLIARKNGKSTLMAADAMYDLFIGSGGQDICTASNDDKQCKLIWDEIAGMMSRLDPKQQISSKNLVEIRNDLKNIKVTRLSTKTQNKDGRNYSKVYLDESHDIAEENGQSEVAEAAWRSMSTKDEPLFINCTTNGFNRDCYLDRKINMCMSIINGELDNPHILPFLYMQDSENEIWEDEASWEKSNPAIRYGVKKTAKLRQDIETAKHDAGTRIHLLCKDFNITTSSAKGWLNLQDYDYAQEPWTLEKFRDCFCVAAVDLSETTDLSCCKLLFMRQDDNTKYIWSHYWLPEMKLQNSDDTNAGASYKEWVRAGHVTVCDGNDIDVTLIADWLGELKKQYGIKVLRCYYDQRFAKPFIARLEDIGIESEVVQQSKYTLSSPTKLLESDLKANIINYNSNPVDKWCYSNAALDVDNVGRILIVKQRGQYNKRIDGAVCAAILYAGYQRCRSDFDRLIK